jgi:hypothetical protein
MKNKKYESVIAEIIYLNLADCLTVSVAGDYVGDELPEGAIHMSPWAQT